MFEIKPEDVCEGSSNNKEEFHFTNYSAKSKYCDNSNKLLIGKIKDENAGVTIFWIETKNLFILGRRK